MQTDAPKPPSSGASSIVVRMVKRQRPKTQKELAYQAKREAEEKEALDAWIKCELEKAPPLTLERWRAIVRLYQTSAKPPRLDQGQPKS